MTDLKGIKAAVIGGDVRQVELANGLLECGADVQCYATLTEGLDPYITLSDDAKDLFTWADTLVFPVTGTDPDGVVRCTSTPVKLDEELLSSAKKGTPIFIGSAAPKVKNICQKLELPVYETMKNDELAILNSIPSAEGAIVLAISMTPFTIHDSSSAVLGFGRTAITLARMLGGMGAKVTVVARKPSDRARAFEMGFESTSFKELGDVIGGFDLVFNTVPHMVLDRQHLSKMKKGSYIVDIASAPGGVDFEAAKELGIEAKLAPGLPGKVAPLTAGKMLSKVVSQLIAEVFSQGQ